MDEPALPSTPVMTAAQWKRAVQPTLPPVEQWSFRGKLAYRRPVDWVLLGVLGEGSGFQRDRVYVWTLVMPLYIQVEHLVLSWSRRVEPAGTFGRDDTAEFDEAIRVAVQRLPTQEEALRSFAGGTSEAADGASKLLRARSTGDLDRLRSVRTATAAALRVG